VKQTRTLKNLKLEFSKPGYTPEDKRILIETISTIDSRQPKKGKAALHPLCYLFKNL